jgi:tetratricopeptide (TPR) repeat protein
MKFVKLFSSFLFLSALIYIAGCTSAEQTTAKLAYSQGDYEKAETEFLKETNQNPANEEAWLYLALSRAQLNKVDGVRSAMEGYRKIGKNTFRAEIEDAWARVYDQGYQDYQNGQTSTDETTQLKKYSDAIKKFEIALALIPDSVFVAKNVSAINSKVNTITIKPMIDKGVELEKAGNYEGAIAEYNKALVKVDKGSAGYEVVAYDIAVANLKWGEKMREANQEDPAYKDKYTAALPFLEDLTKSKEIDNQITAYDLLVQVYANLGRTDDATNAMKMRDDLKAQKK